jgi:hypothetical protein
MKGQMVLEEIFKFLIYIVVAVVVIIMVVNFRHEIAKALNLCELFHLFCPKEGKCENIVVEENSIDNSILKKYCNLCWDKTGDKSFEKNCLCYIVKGQFNPVSNNLPTYCNLKCARQASSILFYYDSKLKMINIEC